MVAANQHGEIADFNEADQFQWMNGKPLSQFACGYYACAIAKSMSPVGKPPTISVQQIINDAHVWYQQYAGDDTIANLNGMTLAQEYALLKQIGLQYLAIDADINNVKQWVSNGYPVIIAVYESSVADMALGDINPYPWIAAGTHIILVTGVTSDGNILVRDSANCTSLSNPNSLRPGPRKYDTSKLRLVSATALRPSWMPDFSNGGEEVLSIEQAKGFFEEVQPNLVWKCKQTGFNVSHGILAYYRSCTQTGLNGLSMFGLPVSNETSISGYTGCVLQRFERATLVWDAANKLDRVPGIAGPCYPAHIDKGPGRDPAIVQLLDENSKLLSEVEQLKQQLAQAKIPPTISTEKQ